MKAKSKIPKVCTLGGCSKCWGKLEGTGSFAEVEPVFGQSVMLPKNVRESLREILNHFLPDEKEHYEATAERATVAHIYVDLAVVEGWFTRVENGGENV